MVIKICILINLETLAPHCTIKKKIKRLTNELDIWVKCYMKEVYFEKMLIFIVFSEMLNTICFSVLYGMGTSDNILL